MKLKRITVKDRGVFDKFLSFRPHQLAVYAFENIYIWKELFEIYWLIIKDCLCVFFKDKLGVFLYLPPLAKKIDPEAVYYAWEIIDELNQGRPISRIENLEEEDLAFFKDLGFIIQPKSCDYLCSTKELIELKGNRFKSKRSCFNYFVKNYSYEYLPFSLEYRQDCLDLYKLWMQQRKSKIKDRIYCSMLEDSCSCLKVLLDNYNYLRLAGRIVKMSGEVKAFTFGFSLNPDIFCILYEITDLSIKGLAQFIFRQFCSELNKYRYINIMDDSGLDNLKQVKLSYHPVRLVSAYTATKAYA